MDDDLVDDGMLDIDLRTFMIVAAIEDAGSITGAAAILGYSQPAISQHLRRSEARLGVPLVQRSGRSSQLTPAGRVVLRVAPGIAQGLTFASRQIRDIRAVGMGRLRIEGFAAASAALVPRMIAHIRAEHPGTVITYREHDPTAALEAIAMGDCDAAIIYRHREAGHQPPDTIDIHNAFRDPYFVALPASLAPARRAVSITEFAGQPWIAPFGEGCRPLVDLARDAGFYPDIPINTDNVSASLQLVAAGFGITLVSRLDLHNLPVPTGVVILPLDPPVQRTIAIATADHHRESAPALSILRAVRAARDEL